MKIFFASLVLVSASLTFADPGDELTRVEKEECLSFPKILDVDAMKEGVHYTKRNECDDRDYEGRCNSSTTWYAVKYYYKQKTTVQYFTAEGKLVATDVESRKYEISVSLRSLVYAPKELTTKIEQKIFESGDPTCADSFYK